MPVDQHDSPHHGFCHHLQAPEKAQSCQGPVHYKVRNLKRPNIVTTVRISDKKLAYFEVWQLATYESFLGEIWGNLCMH